MPHSKKPITFEQFWRSKNPALLQFTNAAYSKAFWTPERYTQQRAKRECRRPLASLSWWEREPVEGWMIPFLALDGATEAQARTVVAHVREAVALIESTRPPWQPFRDLWASRSDSEGQGLEGLVDHLRRGGMAEWQIMRAVRVEVEWRDALDECRKRWAFAPFMRMSSSSAERTVYRCGKPWWN